MYCRDLCPFKPRSALGQLVTGSLEVSVRARNSQNRYHRLGLLVGPTGNIWSTRDKIQKPQPSVQTRFRCGKAYRQDGNCAMRRPKARRCCL